MDVADFSFPTFVKYEAVILSREFEPAINPFYFLIAFTPSVWLIMFVFFLLVSFNSAWFEVILTNLKHIQPFNKKSNPQMRDSRGKKSSFPNKFKRNLWDYFSILTDNGEF